MKQAFILSITLWLIHSVNAQGTWIPRQAMPTVRQEMPGAVVDKKIFVAGGISAIGQTLAVMEAYEPATDSWSIHTLMPEERHHHASAAYDGKVYVFGGYDNIFFNEKNEVFEYDPIADNWTQKASMPQALGAAVAVTFGDYIYLIGGANSSGTLDVNYRYDPLMDNWDTMSAMPTPREHHAAVALDSLIYVAGGRGHPEADVAMEAYSPASDTWYTLTDMPTGRSGIGAAVVNGEVFVIGGEIGGIHSETEAYDPATDSWRSMPDMLTPRHGIATAVINDTIYVIGGATQEGFGPTDTNEAFIVEPPVGIIKHPSKLMSSYHTMVDGELKIFFDLVKPSDVHISVSNAGGKKVADLAQQNLQAGRHEVLWKNPVHPSGLYIYLIRTADGQVTKKCLLF